MAEPEIKNYVKGKLTLQWSPEQIANSLRKDFPLDKALRNKSRNYLCVD